MANTCKNCLWYDSDDMLPDLDELLESSDLGKQFVAYEDHGVADKLDQEVGLLTGAPDAATFNSELGMVYWNSRSSPSVAAILKLSQSFPDAVFTLEYEELATQQKGMLEIKNAGIIDTQAVAFDSDVFKLLINYGMLKMKEGEVLRNLGNGGVTIKCLSADQTDEGGAKKVFNVIFQCDETPMYTVTLDEYGKCDEYVYTDEDEDENESIEENRYYEEMLSDLED